MKNDGVRSADGVRSYYGVVVRALRERRDMTQEDLARAVGLDRPYFAKIETGQIKVPREDGRRDAIAAALGTTHAEILAEVRRLERERGKIRSADTGRPPFDRSSEHPEVGDTVGQIEALLRRLDARQARHVLDHVEFLLGEDER